MRSSVEPKATAGRTAAQGWHANFARWNRKLHYYLGLYLLFFVWLFAVTGLLLNHSQWKFAEFWENRRQTAEERNIAPPPSGNDLAQARDLMRQLGIRGEIEWTTARSDAAILEFRVSRPGLIHEVRVDFEKQKAAIKHVNLNGWGILRILHTFTGVRPDDSRNSRDWWLTSVWAWTMDAVAAGLILMVLSSLAMWYELPLKRRLGLVMLGLGILSCALFCVGLHLLY